MKLLPLLLATSLAFAGLASVPSASAIGCVVGSEPSQCLVAVYTVVCVTEPCDGVIVCLAHGKVCSNRLLP
ncbi:MAG TPA: hypothetical protein VNX21_06390 [Candidatus Thermoplasmatota archaeon]|nr:hypothetical protein [Candidatus Thermoplasmatota archaeon]